MVPRYSSPRRIIQFAMFCLVMASPYLSNSFQDGREVPHLHTYHYDCRSKGRGYKASMKQISGMGCLYHVFIQFTGINADMMFLYHDTGRNELITSGNGIRKLFPSVFTKLSRQFFLFQIVINTFYCQPCYISRFFPGCFSFWVLSIPGHQVPVHPGRRLPLLH